MKYIFYDYFVSIIFLILCKDLVKSLFLLAQNEADINTNFIFCIRNSCRYIHYFCLKNYYGPFRRE